MMKASGNPNSLPALRRIETAVCKKFHEQSGLPEMEVKEVVFESDASLVFARAENCLHTIKAILLATLRS